MKYLSDTHIALWFIDGSPKLSGKAWNLMCSSGNTWYLSTVSVWEVMLKHQAHPNNMEIDAMTFVRKCEESGFKLLDLKLSHIYEAAELPVEGMHKDPFDRALLAQARVDGLTFVTHDKAFAAYEDSHVLLV